MSVNVTIPVPEDFREAAITGSPNLITIADAGDYIIGYDQAGPSKLVRFTKSNLETQSVFTFPADGKHIHATGLYYQRSTGKAYVTFFNPGRLLVSEVDTTVTPMTSTDRVDRVLTGMAPTWIDSDDTFLYVLSRDAGGGGELAKIALSGFTESTPLSLPHFLGSAFCILGGKSYLVGTTELDGTDLTLLRINNATLAIDGTGLFPPALTSSGMELDISPSASEIWVSFRDVPASVYQFNSGLALSVVATAADGDHTGFGFDGNFFWQLFSSGTSLRLNPSDAADTRRYVLDGGYMTELIPAEQYLYVLQSSGIARYRIPPSSAPGSVLLSDCSIHGKTIAVDRSATPTANTIAVGKDSSPFYIFKYSAAPGAINNSCVVGSRTLQLLPGWPKLIGDTISGFFLSDGYAKGIAVDSLGNIIACAGTGPNGNPVAIVFVVKLTPDGNTIWQKSNGVGANGVADAKAVCVDSQDNVIVVGNFWGTVNFGAGNVTATGTSDIFIAKYSPSGSLLFPVKVITPSGSGSAAAVGVDGANNIYVMGALNGSANFGQMLDSGGVSVPYLVKYNSTGTYLLGHVFNGGNQAGVSGIAVTSAGIVTFCGSYFNAFDFGGGPITSPFPAAPTGYLVQINAAGASVIFRFHKNMADADSGCTALGVAMDDIGNAILTGALSGTFDFGANILRAEYNRDIYVAKYNPLGVNVWAVSRSGGPFTIDIGNAVACFANGDVAATGTGFVAKIAA